MFEKVAIGIIAVSTVGFQVWIGNQYIKFLGELSEKEDASEPEEPDTDWDYIYEGLEDLKRLLKEF